MIQPAPDYDAIVRVVQLYIDGFGDSDAAKFEEAFDKDAWIFYTDADGRLHKNLIRESFQYWVSPQPRMSGRIISVTQVGDAANVVLRIGSAKPSDSWVDLHSLIRVDGLWKITNKTATHASRAGGI